MLRTSLLGSVTELTRSWAARRTLRKSAEKRLYSAVAVIQDLEPRRLLSAVNLFPTNPHPLTAQSVNGSAGHPVAIAVGDVNGDGVPDVVIETSYGYVDIFTQGNDGHGKGTGVFTYNTGGISQTYNIGAIAGTSGGRDGGDLVIGKLPDGDPFIAAAMNDSDEIAILIGDGEGHFAAPYAVNFPGSGFGDITSLSVVSNYTGPEGALSLFVGSSAGHTAGVYNIDGLGDAFVEGFGTYDGPIINVATGDFKGDGKTDFVVNTEDGLYVYEPGVGHRIELGEDRYYSIAVGPLTPGSKVDSIAAVSKSYSHNGPSYQRIVTFIGGPGGLSESPSQSYNFYPAEGVAGNIQIADVNGDGNPDLMVTDYTNFGGYAFEVGIYGFKGNGLGAFSTPYSYDSYNGDTGVLAANPFEHAYLGDQIGQFADMNGDGKADLAFAYNYGPNGELLDDGPEENSVSLGVFENTTPTITNPPALTTTPTQFEEYDNFTVGTYGSFTFSVSGNPTPTITLDGTLPANLIFTDNGDGTATIHGTPAPGTGGSYEFSITITNSAGSVTIDPGLMVNAPPLISSPIAATFTPGVPNSFTVTTTGYPTASIAITAEGDGPDGLNFQDNGNGTATLSGIPTDPGTFDFDFKASNTEIVGGVPTVYNSPVQDFVLVVGTPAAITSANNTTFTIGTTGSFTVTTTGDPVPAISEGLEGGNTTTLAELGLTLVDNGNGTATLSGAPLASDTPGAYTYTITADAGDSIGSPASQIFTLTIDAALAPVITSANNATFTIGSAGSFTITTTGSPTAAITETPSGASLASLGLALVDNGNGTATISGTPLASDTPEAYTYTITANNGVGPNGTQTFTLTIDPALAPVITSANNTTFTIGSAGSFLITTTASPVAAITQGVEGGNSTSLGMLGLTFTDNGNGTCTLGGTPLATDTPGTYTYTITADNGVGPNATQVFTLTIDQALALTTTTLEFSTGDVFTVGSFGTFTFDVTGTPTPQIFLDSALPAGLSFTDNGDGTGTISGTPAPGTGGSYEITITITNSQGSVTIDPPLIIDQPPLITSATSATFTAGKSGSFTVTTTGYPDPAITEVGSVDGLTFQDNGNGTATLSGIPTALGEYPITITANNGIGTAASQPFTIIVDQAPTFTSADSKIFQVGIAGSFTVTTTGFPSNPVLSIAAGSLPSGLTFTDNGNGTATLAGSTFAATGGAYNLTLEANNGVLPPAYQAFVIYVIQTPTITSPDVATFTVGTPGSFTVTTSGFPLATTSVTLGTLPAGLTLVDNGNGTATIAGTPTGPGGTDVVTLSASNGFAPAGTQSLTITVDEAPAFTSANTVTVTVGTAMATFNVTTTGFPSINPELSISAGSLPAGLLFTNNGNGTATITGTAGPLTGGSYDLTIEANNGVLPPAYQSFILVVDQGPAITSPNNTTFTVGSVGAFTVTTTGFPTPVFNLTPAATTTLLTSLGLTLTDNGNGTATLTGTPVAGSGGVYMFTIAATNGSGSLASQVTAGTAAEQTFNLTIDQAPAITSANTVTVTVGTAMATFNVTTTGFPSVDPELSISAGTLPEGLLFTNNGNGTATITGTPGPLTGGTYDLTIEANNNVAPPAYQNFILIVGQAPIITSTNNTTFTVGATGTFTVTSTGFPANAVITDAVEGANTTTLATLGLTLTSVGNGTAILSGTPLAGTGGVYTYTITANNGVAPNATQVFTLTIDQSPEFTSGNTATVTAPASVGAEAPITPISITTSGFPILGGTEKISIAAGSLPTGLIFTDNGNGTASITGTLPPLTGGSYTISIEANNGVAPPAFQSFTLIVDQAPNITSTNGATFTVGAASSFTVTTTAFPNPAISVPGATTTLLTSLGLTFHDNGNGTATLSGAPLTGTGGSYSFTITANNGVAPNATQLFTLIIDQPPAFTNVDTDTVTVGTAMPTFTFTTTGFPSLDPELSISAGSLPAGLLFTNNGNGTATITGTPALLTGGSYDLTIEANNNVAPPAYQNFTLVVDQAPTITSPNNTTFTVGSVGVFTITTIGYPTAAITDAVEGANTTTLATLGLKLTDNGNGTALITGTPLAGTGGVYTYTITANNGVNPNATQVFTLTIDQSPEFTSSNTATVTAPASVGAESPITPILITTTGFPILGGTEKISIAAGSLPTGLIFTDNGNGTATISGTLPPLTGGDYTISIEANNNVAPPAFQSFLLIVDQAPVITSVSSTTFTVGVSSYFEITTTAFPAPSITQAVLAPNTTTLAALGLTFHDNGNGTASISGTPLANTGGIYTYTITANNGVSPQATQTFTLTVDEAPTFTSVPVATFTVGDDDTFTVRTSLTEFPRNPELTLITGTLPSGITFVDNGNGTGTLSGTALALTGGTYDFTIEANNNVAPPALQTFVLTVDQPPVFTSPVTDTVEVGLPMTPFIVTTTGFPLPIISITGGTLPAGLTLVNNGNGTATISGTPTGPGKTEILTLTASNVDDETGTPVTVTANQTFTLIVDQLPNFTNPPYILTLQNVVDPTEDDESNRISMNYNFVQLPVGIFDSFDIDTTGYSPLGETMTLVGGSLPKGMNFVDDGDGIATISGTPQHAGSGKDTITVQTNYIGVGIKDTIISIDVDGAEVPTITSTSSKTLLIGSQDIAGTQAGTAGFFTFTSTGFPKANFSLTGVVPSGSGGEDGTTETITSGETLADFGLPDLTFTDNGDGTATISGSLQTGVDMPDVYTFTVDANNGIKNVTKTFKLTVMQAIDFTNPTPTDLALSSQWIGTPLTTGTVGDGYDFDVTTNINNNTNLPKGKLTASGLPSGLKFTDNGNGSGLISGTPTKAGTFTVTITATQGSLSQKIQSTLIIDGPNDTPALKTTTVNVKKNKVFSTSIGLTGGPGPITVDQSSISGLPDGLTLTGNGSKSNPELILKGAVGLGSYTVTFGLVAFDGTENEVTLTIDAA
jgi:large repetitive protein